MTNADREVLRNHGWDNLILVTPANRESLRRLEEGGYVARRSDVMFALTRKGVIALEN